jgi:hypothetical protein
MASTARIPIFSSPRKQSRSPPPAEGGAIELALAALRVRLRGDDADTLTIPTARVAGTLAGLGRGELRELVIVQPRVNVTDRALAWRPPPMGERASARAHDERDAAREDARPPSAFPPWKIGRLAITGGHGRVDLAGAPLAEFGFGTRWQEAAAESAELQSVEVLDLSLRTRQAGVEPFLRVPAIRAEFRFADLLQQRRLARVRVEHLDFRYNTAFRELILSRAKPVPIEKPATAPETGLPPTQATSVAPSSSTSWRVQAGSGAGAPPVASRAGASPAPAGRGAQPTLPAGGAPAPLPGMTTGELRLIDGRIHLDDLGVGVPGIECRVQTAFRELALVPGGGVGGHELQTIELSKIALRSPLDPFVTVLDLDAVFIRFTLAGIWRREIEEVAIVRPTLAVGPDLSWYIDRVQQNQSDPAAPPAIADDGPPWAIRMFSAEAGQLVLALEGQTRLALPCRSSHTRRTSISAGSANCG